MSILHRIEALAGLGRYSVSFARPDGVEQSAVVQVSGAELIVAPASLPSGWSVDSAAFVLLTEAVLAVDRARGTGPESAALADVDGGWDVMMGNVALGPDGVPTCAAHGPMHAEDERRYVCAECSAQALVT